MLQNKILEEERENEKKNSTKFEINQSKIDQYADVMKEQNRIDYKRNENKRFKRGTFKKSKQVVIVDANSS